MSLDFVKSEIIKQFDAYNTEVISIITKGQDVYKAVKDKKEPDSALVENLESLKAKIAGMMEVSKTRVANVKIPPALLTTIDEHLEVDDYFLKQVSGLEEIHNRVNSKTILFGEMASIFKKDLEAHFGENLIQKEADEEKNGNGIEVESTEVKVSE